jgi:hypothetical protein
LGAWGLCTYRDQGQIPWLFDDTDAEALGQKSIWRDPSCRAWAATHGNLDPASLLA